MGYYKVTIYTSHAGIEPLSAVLMESGFDSIVVDDPADVEDILNKKEQYEWDYIDPSVFNNKDKEPTITVYFDDETKDQIPQMKACAIALKTLSDEGVFGDLDLGSLEVEETVISDDWKDKWKEFFKPSKITDSLVVKPTWEEYTPAEGEQVIEIDPGMAFGMEIFGKIFLTLFRIVAVGCFVTTPLFQLCPSTCVVIPLANNAPQSAQYVSPVYPVVVQVAAFSFFTTLLLWLHTSPSTLKYFALVTVLLLLSVTTHLITCSPAVASQVVYASPLTPFVATNVPST